MTARRSKAVVMLAGTVMTLIGCVMLVRLELDSLRNAFETDARIVHRLLSQRAAQQDAVMSMLTLLQPAAADSLRITAVYPHILDVRQRDGTAPWNDPQLQAAATESQRVRRAVATGIDFEKGRYHLLQSTLTAGYAAQIDLRGMVPWEEWPMPVENNPVRVALEYQNQRFMLQPGSGDSGLWRFDFRKRLATESQPFDVTAARRIGWTDLPWLKMLAWVLITAAVLAALLAIERQRAERRRAEELLRLGQVARLNTLGELAGGIAHELNQPLTAVLANTQAAGRLLNDNPPELDTARDAMRRATEQARRASDVVTRLRRVVERPDTGRRAQPVNLEAAVHDALYLLDPELQRLSVRPVVSGGAVTVSAEPVALEQIIHNLLSNALQAMAQLPPGERSLHIAHQADGQHGLLIVSDSGPGIPADVLPRLFEPFFTTREGGLGLGLSLCESLAAGMNGSISAANRAPRGAVFTLQLPLAGTA